MKPKRIAFIAAVCACFAISSAAQPVQKLSKQQIHQLALLGQVWGFLKYYHPEVAKGKFDWDKELFQKIPAVKNAINGRELSDIFLNWIDRLGTVRACRKCDQLPQGLVTYNLDENWMSDILISQPLQQKLLYIKNNRHQGPGYYVKYAGALQAEFINEKDYDSAAMIYPDEHNRLHFLFRYWSTVNYFFPYKIVIGKNWMDALHEFIPLFAEAGDSLQYQIAAATLIHSINDSHTMSANPVLQNEYGKLFIPVRTKIINGEAVVTGYYNDSLGKLTGLQPGDVIETVGDKTVKELIAERAPLVCGSNDPRRWMNLLLSYNYIFGGKETTAGLTVRNKKGRTAITVNRYRRDVFNYQPAPDSVSKILPGNIGYINLGKLKVADVNGTLLKLKDCHAIIFDIRNHCRDIFTPIAYNLLESQQPFAKILYPNLDYPGTYLWKEASKTGPAKPHKNIYKGKVVLLVNENCISHDEWTTMALQTVPGSVTIGSQTAGADGNVSPLLLPGKISSFITGLGVFYPNGSPTQRVGVKVDIEARPTAEGIREGRDEVLDRAVKYIQDGR